MQKIYYCECGNRLSDNRAKRCIECVKKNKKKYTCIDCGVPVQPQRKRCKDCDLKSRKDMISGSNNPRWNGGRPVCVDCGSEITNYDGTRCVSCHAKHIVGNKNPRWKGGTKITYHGYRQIHAPDHPNSDSHGYIMEHRLVMSKHIGRALRRGEVVHHVDGDRLNNSIENLKLHTSSTHHSIEHCQTSKFAEAMKILYEAGHPMTEIAKMFHVSYPTVRTRLLKLGVKFRKRSDYQQTTTKGKIKPKGGGS